MSFFHVLPSNVAPETFAKNNASYYSTPIPNEYQLKGKWEVAVLNMTHSGCVNTFHNDHMTVEKAFVTKDHLEAHPTPVRIRLTPHRETKDLFDEINTKLDGVMRIKFIKDNKHCQWDILMPGAIVVLSKKLMHRLKLWSDVLVSWDLGHGNYWSYKMGDLKYLEDYDITVIPPSHARKTVVIKSKNEDLSSQKFMTRFNNLLKGQLTIQLNESKKNFFVTNSMKPNMVAVMNKNLHRATNFQNAGMNRIKINRYMAYDFQNTFKEEWEVYLYEMNNIEEPNPTMTIPITLPSVSLKQHSDAIAVLNEATKNVDIEFSLNKDNVMSMKIKKAKTNITFSNTLRDIFAFDKNSYTGEGTFEASDFLSLSRRINYLYVYSSISDFVRIGDTEAPLLAVIPFNPERCNNLLREKTFKVPMYVPVIRNPISQIDIALYDGAGELIPFVTGAVTSVRLHFRQV